MKTYINGLKCYYCDQCYKPTWMLINWQEIELCVDCWEEILKAIKAMNN